jgi:hypothetical protein
VETSGAKEPDWAGEATRAAAMLGRPPKSATNDQAAMLDVFLRDHVRNMACRAYATLLAKGRDAEALEAASVLLKVDDSALSKAALVTTALAHQPPQAREHQRAWAKESALANPVWKDLEAAVVRGDAAPSRK